MQTEKITGYKFLHKADLAFWEEGSLRISLMSNYANQDGHTVGDIAGREDTKELLLEVGDFGVIGGFDPSSKPILDNLRNIGLADLQIGQVRHLEITHCTMRRKNRFVFCVSETFNEVTFRKWHAAEGYDAVIKVPDLQRFACAIDDADRRGRQLLTESGFGTIEKMQYFKLPFSRSEFEKTSFEKFTFFKDSDYEWQRELRLSWPIWNNDTASIPIEFSPYDLVILGLNEYFEVLEVPSEWLSS